MDPQLEEIVNQLTALNSRITGVAANISKLAMTAKGSAAGRAAAVGGSGGGDLKSALSGVFGMFTAKLAVIFGPLAAFATLLGSANSGFSVFLKTVNLLGAVLAPILLPAFALLGAAVLTVADLIWAKLAPNLKNWIEFILSSMIPACKQLSDAFEDAAEIIRRLGKTGTTAVIGGAGTGIVAAASTDDAKGPLGRLTDGLKKFGILGGITGAGAGILAATKTDAAKESPVGKAILDIPGARGAIGAGKGGAAIVAPVKESPFAKFINNLKLFAQEMLIESGPKPQFMGVAQANRAAQQAALGQSPMEARMQAIIQKSIQDLIEAIHGVEQKVGQVNLGAG